VIEQQLPERRDYVAKVRRKITDKESMADHPEFLIGPRWFDGRHRMDAIKSGQRTLYSKLIRLHPRTQTQQYRSRAFAIPSPLVIQRLSIAK
jgi:hypothetical protein